MLALFLCTAGIEIEQISKQLFTDADYTKGYIADVIGTAIVETAMNRIQHEFQQILLWAEGFLITNR